MKIAVVEFAGRGGLIHYAYQLCAALAAAGADVTLVTGADYELDRLPHSFALDKRLRLWDPKPAGDVRPSGALRRAGRGLRYYFEWARLAAHLARTRPDVVQLGDLRFPTDLACVLALKAAGLKVADVCHNVDPFRGGRGGGMPRRSRAAAAAYRALYRACDVVFAHFESSRAALVERYGLPEDGVVAIPHGDESLFDALRDPAHGPDQVRAELGIGSGAPLVLLFGTLTAYKGIEGLIRAFATVAARRPDARLAIAGFPASDFDVEGTRGAIREAGLDHAVRLVPRYVESDEVAGWMEAATVAVFPYRAVWQSGAVVLAQTFGVPAVAFDVGAMRDEIEDGVSGLLVAPGNERALAAALLRLLDDPGAAKAMGRRGAARVRAQFAWSRVAAVMIDRYAALLGRPAIPAAAERARP